MDGAADRGSCVHHRHACLLQSRSRCLRDCFAGLSRNEWTDKVMSARTTIPAPKKKRRLRKWLAPAAAALFVAWMGFFGDVNWAMHQPPKVFAPGIWPMP